ncbi:RNA polymerase sigma factor sigC [Cornus florida]|uniref:RNA polymerase sigma factor sigC n=1 Tax=Cornus florida TaxID=4283 RepID=UPI00289B7A7E|nr:RNA polymerase sigma factor sigC [Cornus florida]
MGTGFRLNLKWGFAIHSPSFTNSSSWPSSSYSFRGRESSYDLAKMSFPSVVSWESEASYNDLMESPTRTSASQTLENYCLETERMKVNVGKRSHVHIPSGENKLAYLTSLQAKEISHYSLLMKNLNILEEMFSSSDVLRLENDILIQLERLGALKLFHACLVRTLKTPNFFDLSDAPTELVDEHRLNGIVDDHHLGKIVVRSGKKEERKSRRERASEKANFVSALALPSKTIHKDPQKSKVSSSRRPSKSKGRRLKMVRNEAEMSRGVKLVTDLERIRTILEQETGQVASLSSWAEAAGVDKKELQQQLHFGWYCMDELIKSSRSLVLYLARNYSGLGVAFEDLIQAGKSGVLQGAERFDHTRGYKFSTYVQYWIRKSMSTLVAQHARGIRIPFTLSKAINQIQKARKTLNYSHGKYPDDDEIAKFTGLSLAKITSASKCLRVVGSIDQKVGDNVSAKFLEFTPDTSVMTPEETVMRQHMLKDMHNLLRGLDPRERRVLVLRFGLRDHQRKSLEEIGKLFHVSKEWIRKIERKALAKLRDEETCTNLSHYL